MLLPLLLPAFVRAHPPSFTHSHSSTSTHPIPLTAPVLCSRSPALVRPLLFPCSHKPARSFAFARLPPARSFVLVSARSSVLVPVRARSCGVRLHSFVLTCPAYSCLFLSLFGLCSCLFVPARLFARLAFVWPPFALVCARSPRLPALICVCIKYMVSTYIMNRLTFLS